MYIDNFGIFNQLFLRPDSIVDINEQLSLKSKRLSLGLGLSDLEKRDLIEFLKNGLTELGDNTPEDLAKNVLKESWKLP